MVLWAKKANPHGDRVRQSLSAERLSLLNRIAASGVPGSVFFAAGFYCGRRCYAFRYGR